MPAMRTLSGRGIRRRDRRGYTALESLLVLLIVILVVAFVLIPRLIGAKAKSRETALQGDLHELRTAIQRFEADTGAFPPAVGDVMAPTGDAISADTDGRGISVDKAGYHGPYLTTGDDLLPKDAITKAADWDYNNVTGMVRSASPLHATDGTFYADW